MLRAPYPAGLDTEPEVTLTLRPIGFVRSEKRVKFHARHQPMEEAVDQTVLELRSGGGFEQAVRDLAGFSRIWLVWWFHRNTDWRPLVLPPRGVAQRRGVFATRSPHRPNPLGITPVPLLAVRGRTLVLGACDLVDGTPVFDIKPYISAYDSFPDATGGWLDEVEKAHQQPPQFQVRFLPLAVEQAEWLRTHWDIDFRPRLTELLERDPSPHRSRRIRRRSETQWVIGCGAWRAVFSVRGCDVSIEMLETAYPLRFLHDPLRRDIPDRPAQIAFSGIWTERPLRAEPGNTSNTVAPGNS